MSGTLQKQFTYRLMVPSWQQVSWYVAGKIVHCNLSLCNLYICGVMEPRWFQFPRCRIEKGAAESTQTAGHAMVQVAEPPRWESPSIRHNWCCEVCFCKPPRIETTFRSWSVPERRRRQPKTLELVATIACRGLSRWEAERIAIESQGQRGIPWSIWVSRDNSSLDCCCGFVTGGSTVNCSKGDFARKQCKYWSMSYIIFCVMVIDKCQLRVAL